VSTIDDIKLMEDTSHAPTHQHRLILVITRVLETSKLLEALEINKTSTSENSILLILVITLVPQTLIIIISL
jgi:hypothetical protein